MINSEVIRNYISPKYIAWHQLKTREKRHAYKLALADGKPMR
jgi:hypothetical protein